MMIKKIFAACLLAVLVSAQGAFAGMNTTMYILENKTDGATVLLSVDGWVDDNREIDSLVRPLATALVLKLTAGKWREIGIIKVKREGMRVVKQVTERLEVFYANYGFSDGTLVEDQKLTATLGGRKTAFISFKCENGGCNDMSAIVDAIIERAGW